MKKINIIRSFAFWLCFIFQIILWIYLNINLNIGTYNLINKNDVPFDQWGKELYYLMWLLLLIMPKYKSLFLIFLYVLISYNDEILYLYVSAKNIDINDIYVKDYIIYSLQSYYWYFLENIVQEPLLYFGRIIKFIILTIIMVIEIYIPILGFYVGVYLVKKIGRKYKERN